MDILFSFPIIGLPKIKGLTPPMGIICALWNYIYLVSNMGGATLSPERPGPHQILYKMTSGPRQKMTSVTRPHQ